MFVAAAASMADLQVSMTAAYSDNSAAQNAGGKKTADIVAKCARIICKMNPEKTTFTIAEHGCATGANSLAQVQAFANATQGVAKQITVIMNDRAENQWDVLQDTIKQNFDVEINDGLLHLVMVPASMYTGGALFPAGTVDITFTNYALNWLSKVPTVFEGMYIHDLASECEDQLKWHLQQHEDLSDFLTNRSVEIAIGGFLILGIQARNHRTGSAGWQGLSTMGEVKQLMIADGCPLLDCVDPEYNRSIVETLACVDTSVWHIVSVEEEWIECPFHSKFERGDISLSECARQSTELYKACTSWLIADFAEKNGAVDSQGVVDLFYDRLEKVMATDPTGLKASTAHPYHYVVLQRAKLQI